MAPDELQPALTMIETNKKKLGTFVLLIRDGEFGAYDATAQRLPYSGPGLAGSDKLDPPLSFATNPTVTRGEMPGFGGHGRLDLFNLHGTVAVDPSAAQVLIDANKKDPLVTEFLVELEGEGEVDNLDVIQAHLHGIRVVRQGSHEVYLDGTPTKLGYSTLPALTK